MTFRGDWQRRKRSSRLVVDATVHFFLLFLISSESALSAAVEIEVGSDSNYATTEDNEDKNNYIHSLDDEDNIDYGNHNQNWEDGPASWSEFGHDNSPEICGLPLISVKEWESGRYWERDTPIMVANVTAQWDALHNWQLSEMLQRYPNAEATMGDGRRVGEIGPDGAGNLLTPTTVREFVTQWMYHPQKYFFDRKISIPTGMLNDCHPFPEPTRSFLEDPTRDGIYAPSKKRKVNPKANNEIWRDHLAIAIGNDLQGLSFHHHGAAWNTVIFGKKRWILYDPKRWKNGPEEEEEEEEKEEDAHDRVGVVDNAKGGRIAKEEEDEKYSDSDDKDEDKEMDDDDESNPNQQQRRKRRPISLQRRVALASDAPWQTILPTHEWIRQLYPDPFRQHEIRTYGHDCIQHAGTMMFVPRHWMHMIVNIGDTVSVVSEVGLDRGKGKKPEDFEYDPHAPSSDDDSSDDDSNDDDSSDDDDSEDW